MLKIDAWKITVEKRFAFGAPETTETVCCFPECDGDAFKAIEKVRRTWEWISETVGNQFSVHIARCDRVVYTPYFDDDPKYSDPRYAQYQC